MKSGPIPVAERIAEEVLFPSALEVDQAEDVPVERLDMLAEAGLYGLAGPADAGGMGLPDLQTGLRIVETLAGGCLTTTFVWMQHHGVVRALNDAPSPLRESWLEPLCRGTRRAGIAYSGLRRPGPPVLRAQPVDGGWALDGVATWVTGWGRIDVIRVGARAPGGEVVWLLMDALASPSLRVERLRLAAVNASATVTLHFDDHRVPSQRLLGTEPYDEWVARDRASLRNNGSLALGIAGRCASLLGPSRFDAALLRCRQALDGAAPDEMPAARGAASALAMDLAVTLVAAGGGRSILLDQHAQRLAREALFLLVFGQTAAIREVQLGQAGNVP